MKKTILVTGCCGFIGSNFCEFLIERNYNVIGIDNLITGRLKNIKKIFEHKNFNFIEHDVCSKITIKKKVDKILHFASPASPKEYILYPIKTLNTGSIGTENVLKFGLKNKSVVLVASTSEVYGDPLEHPQNEKYFGNVNPIGPRSVYDEAKRYLEAITIAYHRKFNLDTKIVRIFNTYGPKMKKNDGRAIPNFINQLINNENISIYGDGNQTRSFCYIDDTVKGIYNLLNSKYNYPINIGNPVEYKINQLVSILKNHIPSASKIVFTKLPEDDPKVRKPDISLANEILQWKPKTSLEDGLKRTINYFYNY